MDATPVAWSALAAALAFGCVSLIFAIDALLLFRGLIPISLVTHALSAAYPRAAILAGGTVLFAIGVLFGHLVQR